MAVDVFPSWLTVEPFRDPLSVLTAATSAGINLSQQDLAREQVAREAQQQQAANQLARQKLQQDAAQAAIAAAQNRDQLLYNYAALGQEGASDARNAELREEALAQKAREDAARFAGLEGFQRDVNAGMKPQDAIIRNIGNLAFTAPSVLGDFLSQSSRVPVFKPEQVGIPSPTAPPGFTVIPKDLYSVAIERDPGFAKPLTPLDLARQKKYEAEAARITSLLNSPVLSTVDKLAMQQELETAFSPQEIDLIRNKYEAKERSKSQSGEPERKSKGGYVVGGTYPGPNGPIIYLGGDPSDLASWKM